MKVHLLLITVVLAQTSFARQCAEEINNYYQTNQLKCEQDLKKKNVTVPTLAAFSVSKEHKVINLIDCAMPGDAFENHRFTVPQGTCAELQGKLVNEFQLKIDFGPIGVDGRPLDPNRRPDGTTAQPGDSDYVSPGDLEDSTHSGTDMNGMTNTTAKAPNMDAQPNDEMAVPDNLIKCGVLMDSFLAKFKKLREDCAATGWGPPTVYASKLSENQVVFCRWEEDKKLYAFPDVEAARLNDWEGFNFLGLNLSQIPACRATVVPKVNP